MDPENTTLGEAATAYLASLPDEDRAASQQDVNQFALWYGLKQTVAQLTPPKVANYAERVAASGADSARKLTPVKAFLAYLKKEGLTKTNLSVHLKVRKSTSSNGSVSCKPAPKLHALTAEGRKELEKELDCLKGERPKVAEELHRAAADKDFRENAPLDAAREHQGQMESRIRELEAILKASTFEHAHSAAHKVRFGDKVRLCEIASGEVVTYALVAPSEASPARGKISIESPTGKALLGKEEGAEIEVLAPGGKIHYRVEHVQR